MTFVTKIAFVRTRKGFTLIELLVVIGIIALLIGILAPAALMVLRRANAARVRADLNTIATALEVYNNDFHSYPLVTNVNPATGASIPGTGAHVLCQALFGLGPAYPISVTNFGGADGADGPGFRVRRTLDDGLNPHYTQSGVTAPWTMTSVAGVAADGIPDSFGGKVYGPYLKPENFRFDTDPAFSDFAVIRVLDHTNSPILYYQASAPGVNLGATSSPLIAWPHDPLIATVTTPAAKSPLIALTNYQAIFNAYDNSQDMAATPQISLNQLLVMLGDYDCNNQIVGTEPTSTSLPYLLWSRGADGKWGPQDIVAGAASADANRQQVEKCDDITNFR